jgi:hypothetical protein
MRSQKLRYCRVNSNACLQGKTKYLVMHVTVRLSNLLIPPLSKHQEFLYNKIIELKKTGMSDRKISKYFNDNNIKTPRGNKFFCSSVYSIVKKRKIRQARIDKPFEITYNDWYIEER